ncbi:MAG: class II histone deacetylase, partial [Rubrobacteraceae bacterium]
INVPLPPGSGEGAYLAAFERVVIPALRAHRPALILVASGLDASMVDPLGRMMLHSRAYRRMARLLMDAADEICEGRIVMCHEGGYSTSYVPFCGLAVTEELSGIRTEVKDPFLREFELRGYQELQLHQESVIQAAADRVSRIN